MFTGDTNVHAEWCDRSECEDDRQHFGSESGECLTQSTLSPADARSIFLREQLDF